MKALPQKQKISIRGASLEYVTSGTGSPAIVLVNGSGGPIEGWYKVYAQLKELGTVFAYNRFGIGECRRLHFLYGKYSDGKKDRGAGGGTADSMQS